ncbi:MAG TPA: hypothetical protein VHM30_07730 [Gemmatimonadaceae bacterium]|nr:hypothetical protein [Gemmatimonadaceae bacterium]
MSLLRLALVCALALGCSTRPSVLGDVRRGVPAAELIIRLTAAAGRTPAAVERVEISTRGVGRSRGTQGHVEWAIARQSGAPAMRLPAEIRYGTVPPGFGSNGPAPVLANGHYELRVMAGGVWSVTRFNVSDINVVE